MSDTERRGGEFMPPPNPEMRESEPARGRFEVSADSMASWGHPKRNDDHMLGVTDNRTRELMGATKKEVERCQKLEAEAAARLKELNVHGVFDGVSLSNGDVASRVSAGIIADALAKLPPDADGDKTEQALRQAFRDANYESLSLGAYTTADVIRIIPRGDDEPAEVAYAHIGDTRIYVRHADGKLEQITTDMNAYNDFISRQVANGNMRNDTEQLLRRAKTIDELPAGYRNLKGLFDSQHELTGSLGASTKPVIGRFALLKGESVVIVSDGVHDNVSDEEMEKELAVDAPNPAGRLNRLAMEKASQIYEYDDIIEEMSQIARRKNSGQAKQEDGAKLAELQKRLDSPPLRDNIWVKGYDDATSVVITYAPDEKKAKRTEKRRDSNDSLPEFHFDPPWNFLT